MSSLDVQVLRMYTMDWVTRLARDAGLDLSERSQSGPSFTAGNQAQGVLVRATFLANDPYIRFESTDKSRQREVDAWAAEAANRLRHDQYGDRIWYSATSSELAFSPISPHGMGALMARLSEQVRIQGPHRLGEEVLLHFKQQGSDVSIPQLLAPAANVHIHVAVPAPCRGHASDLIAHTLVEVVSAICSFALGRVLDLPHVVGPTPDDQIASLEASRRDPSIGTLARRGVSLDILSEMSKPGGLDHFQRVRRALLTFEAAMRQVHDAVACILYVVAAECLTVPNTSWRDSKLTKRFVEFFDDLMPGKLDELVRHGNFEEVFGIRRGSRKMRPLRREMLEAIYDYRSTSLHAGLSPAYRGVMGAALDAGSTVRRSLFAEFAEEAILGYLRSPRSSLIGHPNLGKPGDVE